MISKLGVGILLSVATLFLATPTKAFADAAADKAKIKKYFTQLKKLPNAATPFSKVNGLLKKLSKLDPKKASKYYKVGLTKLSNPGGTAVANANKLALVVTNIVKKSGLSSSQVAKIQRQVVNDSGNYVPPPPTSPSAMLFEASSLLGLA